MPRWIAIVGWLASIAGCAQARADQRAGGEAVVQRHCARCHSGPRAQSDFNFAGNTAQLIASGLVVPGDAAGSLLYQRVAAGEMPPEGAARPSAAELAALRGWIDGMPPATRVRGELELARLLAADAAALAPADRAHARWLTLAHLANAGAPEAQLDDHRRALALLLASLTWAPAPPAPIAVDPEHTMFRIDLRELGWTTATWDAIRAGYPYGVARGAATPDAIRADWFVATASRAPLYHRILELPDSEAELARRLGVDLAANVLAGRVQRAGFNGSGVSVNNRLIERHATRHGALWRSYDFRSSVDRENLFAHPLDFVPAGGEIIFNLPNGLQGYLLVDGDGRRIDKAPTAIVSDPRRPDRSVETALSCIGCHAAGIIPRADQLRDASDELGPRDRARVLRLHPPGDELAALYAGDRARFARALARLGARPPADPADEPISALAARYEADLDVRLAAAELGLTRGELEARLLRSAALRRELGGLVIGASVKRDQWAAAFPRLLVELGAGVPHAPAASHEPAPAVWIDGQHRSWLAATAAPLVDQAGALARCRGLGLELPRSDELVAAIREGLAGGAQLAAPLWTAGARLDAANQRYASVVDPISGVARRADVADRHAVVCVQR